MEALRLEADDSAAKVDELSTKVKALEQENMQKEQEITSLQHRNGVLEKEVEKLEGLHKDAKAAADESVHHGTQNEAHQRKIQVLEEEAEQTDKVLRETNEKYVMDLRRQDMTDIRVGYDSPTSRPVTTSARFKHWSKPQRHGRRSTRRWQPNMLPPRRSSMTLWLKLVTSRRCLLQHKHKLCIHTHYNLPHVLIIYISNADISFERVILRLANRVRGQWSTSSMLVSGEGEMAAFFPISAQVYRYHYIRL